MYVEPRIQFALWLLWGVWLPACATDGSTLTTTEMGGASGFPSLSASGGSANAAAEPAGTQATGGTSGARGVSLPTGGFAGAAGGGRGGEPTVAEGGAPEAGNSRRPRCLSRGSQVALLGDSYINWVSHTFPGDLNREANQTFRDYAIGAWAMGSGGIGLIPTQFDKATAEDPDILAIVMDGGGNDVLVPAPEYPQGGSCKNQLDSPTIPDCQKIVETAMDAASTLLDKVANAGIRDVLYFFYPHVPEGTLIGGQHPNAILDYALPKARAFCDGARTQTNGKLTCHFLDLVPVFAGHPEYFALTDIHPNPTGSAAMAGAVWQMMKDACIAQPASSGCCEP